MFNTISIHINLELDTCSRDSSTNFPLHNCLFGAMKLTKNVNPDKYGYSGYGTGFEALSEFS